MLILDILNGVCTLLSSLNSIIFHVVTFKMFHNFPSLGVFFDLKQFNRHRLWCLPKCMPFALFNYSSLSYIVLALSSAVTKLLKKNLNFP